MEQVSFAGYLSPEHPELHTSADSKVRKPLPATSVEILKTWLFSPEHVTYPYPTADEQKQLSKATGLTSRQLKNWFTNARRRIWKKHNETVGVPQIDNGKPRRKKAPKNSKPKERIPVASAQNSTAEPPLSKDLLRDQDFGNLDNIFSEGKGKHSLKQEFNSDLKDALSFLMFDDPALSSQKMPPSENLAVRPRNCFEDFTMEPQQVAGNLVQNGQKVEGLILDQNYGLNSQQTFFVVPSKFEAQHVVDPAPLPSSRSNLSNPFSDFPSGTGAPAPQNPSFISSRHAANYAQVTQPPRFPGESCIQQPRFIMEAPPTNFVANTHINDEQCKCYICNQGGNDTRIEDCGHSFHGECLRIATLFYAKEESMKCPKCFTIITSCCQLTNSGPPSY
mmetsp:Transcript_20113/g.30463  ORF Transcript_20113/g.30463 Transcript_20113/m.30463 type:complete len:392 (-) Transcript_20113:282-1457(-)